MKTHRVRDPSVLVSAVRQDLLDTVAALGPATASELARQLGMRVSALYYHLDLLVRSGLLVRRRARRRDARTEALYAARAPRLAVRFDLGSPAGRRIAGQVTRALLRTAERDLARGARLPVARAAAPRRNLWLSRVKGWLTPREVAAVIAHLEAIDALVLGARRGPGKLLCAVSSAMAPLAAEAA